MKELRVIIAGCRDYYNTEFVCEQADRIIKKKKETYKDQEIGVRIVCGEARGVDQSGKVYGKRNGYPVSSFPADWSLGGIAGPMRNEKMAQFASEEIGVLIAFWDGASKGTRSMIGYAKQYGLECFIIMV